MNFEESLYKKYYYSINEVIKNDYNKKEILESLQDKIDEIKDTLFISYDVEEIYLINEFFEKNKFIDRLSVLIELDQRNYEELYETNFKDLKYKNFIDYYFRIHNDYYYFDKHIENFEVYKSWKL